MKTTKHIEDLSDNANSSLHMHNEGDFSDYGAFQ